jgi:hypothetical protein
MRHVALGCILVGLFVGCSGSPQNFGDDDAQSPDDDGSVQPGDDGSTANDATTPPQDGGTTTKDSSTAQDSGAPQDSGQITADSSDGFGAARTACINEINKLRTNAGHAAYTLWESAAIDTCIDTQATDDQAANSAHKTWIANENNQNEVCEGNAQDECLGYGDSPSEIVACLDSMWNERNQSNCTGCDACNSTKLTQTVINCQSTKTCDFYGNYGSECGHYVNMSANYFSYAACGFSTAGGSGQWATQNFK